MAALYYYVRMAVLLGIFTPTIALFAVVVGALMARRNDHRKHLREMQTKAFQEFLARSHDLMVLRGRPASVLVPMRDKIQEQLDAHRTSGTEIQLLTSDVRLSALVDEIVMGLGADVIARMNGKQAALGITDRHSRQLMKMMRQELGVRSRRRLAYLVARKKLSEAEKQEGS